MPAATGTYYIEAGAFSDDYSGSYNVTVSEQSIPTLPTNGLIDSLSVEQQLELIYVGYFDRSADSGGFAFWQAQNATAQANGQSASVALSNIANSFTPQTETLALYPFLRTANFDPNLAADRAQIKFLIDSSYLNLFDRAPDTGGEAYWMNQLLTGSISLGKAILAVANGATGSDATLLVNKIIVADYFTAQTGQAGLGMTAPVPASLLAEARSVLAGVDGVSLNDASVTAAETAVQHYVGGSSNVTTTSEISGATQLDGGRVLENDGTLTFEQAVSGNGTFQLDGSATLDVADVVASGSTMSFLHPGGTLEVQATGLFGAIVSGFATGDVIDAAPVAFNASDTVGFASGTLTVSDGTHSASFGLSGNYSAGSFHLATDGHGGTALTYG